MLRSRDTRLRPGLLDFHPLGLRRNSQPDRRAGQANPDREPHARQPQRPCRRRIQAHGEVAEGNGQV